MKTDPAALVPLLPPPALTAEQFKQLATVPAENEWFTNLGNKGTRRVYEPVIRDFMRFTGIRPRRNSEQSLVPMCSRGAMTSTAGPSLPRRFAATSRACRRSLTISVKKTR